MKKRYSTFDVNNLVSSDQKGVIYDTFGEFSPIIDVKLVAVDVRWVSYSYFTIL